MRIYPFFFNRSIILELKAELKDLHKELLRHSHNDHNETHQSQSASHNTNSTFVTPPAPGPLLQSQYDKVKYWTKTSWQDYVDWAKDKNSGHEPTWTEFITDEKGVQMSKQRLKELWEDAEITWNSFNFFVLSTPWPNNLVKKAHSGRWLLLQHHPPEVSRISVMQWKLETPVVGNETLFRLAN